MDVVTESPADTEALGRRLGAALRPGDVVALVGDLGSGKTVFTRGLVEGAGAAPYVASPTFVLMRVYPGPTPVRHFDLYRLDAPVDLAGLGFDDGVDESISVVEWADRADLPGARRVTLSIEGESRRRLRLENFENS